MNNVEPDLMVAGFHRLDEKLVSGRPPQIKWGTQYNDWEPERKVQYLEKLARTMNHAAYLVQEERNALGKICEKQEGQLIKLNEALQENSAMLQHEVTRMNERRQDFNTQVARLNARIRELEDGSNS